MTSPATPFVATETEMLRNFLASNRWRLVEQARGLTTEQVHQRLEPSTLTLGGLLRHMTLVEDYWFNVVLAGDGAAEPWASADWEGDPDWEFTTAAGMEREQLIDDFRAALARADAAIDACIDNGLDQLAALERHGAHPTLRWILVHMIEEYARHNGRADFIRESIDGVTGT